MTDHDPLCPTVYLPGEGGCRCALIARVRADERQHTPYSRTAAGVVSRILSEADMAARPGQYDRLVAIANEVAALTRWKDEATAVIEAWERVHALLGKPGFLGESKAEAAWVEVRDLLDARNELVEAKRARREAERDRDFTIAMADELMVQRDAARAEVAALRELVEVQGRNIRREALADLRAAVQAERDKHGPGRAQDRGVHYHCGRCDALELVLDLIDKEGDR